VVRLTRTEVTGGLVLLASVAAALVWANLAPGSYTAFWSHTVGRADHAPELTAVVNRGLMTVFFLAVGLEIGRERTVGSLAENRNAVLPVAAALGGMVGAALVYLIVAVALGGDPSVLRGWGVPMATDVAFTLGALALAGSRVPTGLRVFVLALAVADDVASVVVLAFVSSTRVSVPSLLAAVAALAGVAVMRRWVRRAWWPYLAAVALVWWLFSRGGVEPTLAGAFVGLLVPGGGRERSPSTVLETAASPLSSYVILPLFALANAGVMLNGQIWSSSSGRSVLLAVVVARTAGKMIGISAAVVVVIRLGGARLPAGVNGRHMVGAAVLCGMGFTVPLLFAATEFAGAPVLFAGAQAGLLIGTAVTFVVGLAIIVARGGRSPDANGPTAAQGPGMG
jgi:NhaA family Na+:H+ antiporter